MRSSSRPASFFSSRSTLPAGLAVVILAAVSAPASALPSFAQQTGYACAQCHTISFGPALTAYGREFKLNGYVFGDAPSQMPLALMVQGGYTRTGADEPAPPAPHFADNNNVSVDQVGLFVAGRVSEHIGAFAQFTYGGEARHFHWDNTDIRYARAFTIGDKAVVAGISLNNNPTVQDLWNSTPAWGFPYIASGLGPTPAATPLIGSLAQTVAGATAYAMFGNRFYIEAGGYRGLPDRWLDNVGLYPGNSPHMVGVSPYLRANVQFAPGDHYFSIGAFGLDGHLQPDPTITAKDRYTDIGFDANYQYAAAGKHALAVNAATIRENRQLDSSFANGLSDSPNSHLRTVHLDASYTYDLTWGAAVAGFDTRGDTNVALYGSGPVSGSANGSPNSQGYILQAEYIPFGKTKSFGRPYLNVRLGLQYTGYTKFNGGTSNYDGSGRNASDNNTLFAFVWVII